MTDGANASTSDRTRQELLAQMEHLVDEVEALKAHLDLIPEPVLTGRPLESDPSFKEIYQLISRFDENVYTPAVSRLAQGKEAVVSTPESARMLLDSSSNERDIRAIIDDVQSSRAALVSKFESLDVDDWSESVEIDGEPTNVLGLAYAITQHDASLLKAAAYRLHESRLTTREEDLPK